MGKMVWGNIIVVRWFIGITFFILLALYSGNSFLSGGNKLLFG